MKKLLLLAILLIGGCAPISNQLITPDDQSPQGTINTAKASLDGVLQYLIGQQAAGTITKADAEKYLGLEQQYRIKINEAEVLLSNGEIANAATRANAVNLLIQALQKELAQRQPQ